MQNNNYVRSNEEDLVKRWRQETDQRWRESLQARKEGLASRGDADTGRPAHMVAGHHSLCDHTYLNMK